MYFGTREHMTDVRCPAINVVRNREKWTTSGTYLNGGGFARGSSYSHALYTIGWNLMSPDEARKILDFYYGNYGDGPIYFLDDFALQGNVLPLHWSVPRLTVKDAPPLVKGVAVSETPLGAINNAGDYPSASATFAWTGTPNSDSVWIPVPPGQNFYFGVRGSRTGTAEITMTRDKPNFNTFTNLITNPSMEATSGTVEVHRNIALNPGPRTADLTRWSFGVATGEVVTGSWVSTPGDGPEGRTGFARRTVTTAKTGGTGGPFYRAVSGEFSGVAGDVRTLSIWARFSHATEVVLNADVRLGTVGAGGTVSNPVQVAANVWTRLSMTVTALGPYDGSQLWVRTTTTAPVIPVGGTYDIADVLIEASSSLGQYFDGTFSPDPDLTPAWAGAANTSASILTGVGVTSVATVSTNARGVSSSQWAKSGTKSARLIPTSAATDSYTSVGGDLGGLRAGMEAGKTYTVLGAARLATPQTGTLHSLARKITVWTKVGAADYVTAQSVAAPNIAGEHEVRYTFTVPVGATEAFIRLYNGAAAGGGDVWWDNIALIEGNYTGPYFDGNTPNTSDTFYAWNGAPNASTTSTSSPADWGTGDPMPTSTTQRTNAMFTDPGGVTLKVTGSGSLTLNSMYASIGTEPPPNGNFRSGEGHTGVVFDGVPQRTGYSAVIGEGLESVSSAFKEVGAWR